MLMDFAFVFKAYLRPRHANSRFDGLIDVAPKILAGYGQNDGDRIRELITGESVSDDRLED